MKLLLTALSLYFFGAAFSQTEKNKENLEIKPVTVMVVNTGPLKSKKNTKTYKSTPEHSATKPEETIEILPTTEVEENN